jgi:hypothetical protein
VFNLMLQTVSFRGDQQCLLRWLYVSINVSKTCVVVSVMSEECRFFASVHGLRGDLSSPTEVVGLYLGTACKPFSF